MACKPEPGPGTHILPASLPLPQPSGRGLPSPSAPPSLRVCALPGYHASSSRRAPGPPGTYAMRTRGLTLSWRVSAEPSSRRCPAAKAVPSPTRAARGRQTEGEGEGGGAACPRRGGKHLLLLPCSVDSPPPRNGWPGAPVPQLFPEEGVCPGGTLHALEVSTRAQEALRDRKPFNQRPQPHGRLTLSSAELPLAPPGVGALRIAPGTLASPISPPKDPHPTHLAL